MDELKELTRYQQEVVRHNGIDPADFKMLAETEYAWHMVNTRTKTGLTLYWRITND